MPGAPLRIFISYSRTNTAFVDHLATDLQARGFETWVDHNIEGGNVWLDEINKALAWCDVLVLAVSPAAMASEWVRMEYRHVLRRKPIIPAHCAPTSEVPAEISSLHYIDCYTNYEQGLQHLLATLNRIPVPQVMPSSSASSSAPAVEQPSQPRPVAFPADPAGASATVPFSPAGGPGQASQSGMAWGTTGFVPPVPPPPGGFGPPVGKPTEHLRPKRPFPLRVLLLFLVPLLVVVLVVVLLSQASPRGTSAQHNPTATTSAHQTPTATPLPVGLVQNFTLPNANSEPGEIITGPDHNLWFTEYNKESPEIGTMTPDGSSNQFSLSDTQTALFSLTNGPDGNIWFTEFKLATGNSGRNAVGRITPGGNITKYSSSASNFAPGWIIKGPDNNLWFTSNASIGRISTSGAIKLFSLPNQNESPGDITAGPDGNLWFTDCILTTDPNTLCGGNTIGRVTTAGAVKEFLLPNQKESANNIITGPDGNLWFTECIENSNASICSDNKIGRITPAGTITEFSIPNPNSEINGITVGPDGNFWFTECVLNSSGNACTASKIGRMNTAGKVIDEFTLSVANSYPEGITTGPDNNLWFTENNPARIGRITSGK